MNAPSEDIVQLLETLGESSDFDDLVLATNLFTGKEPGSPINCVTIFDTPGYGPDMCIDSTGYERPSIQIRVRNKHQRDGWKLIERLKDSLHGLAQTTVNGTLYSVIRCSSSPTLLDFDDNGNSRHVVTFDIQRRVV